MSLQAFLEWFTQGSIVLLAILMVVQWARWRDRVSLDIFLVFGSLAVLLILERALRLTHVQAAWIRPLGASVLLAHPYLLMRVVSHFRPVSRGVRRTATAGLLVSLIVTWIAAWPFRSAALVGLAFLYFIWLLGYAAWAFRQGAQAAGGVTHFRMQHASLGALLLAIVFILAVLVADSAGLARGNGCADSAGRARGGAQLLFRVRPAVVASPHVAVVRAVRVSVRPRARRQVAIARRGAESSLHVRRSCGWGHQRFCGGMG